MEEINNLEILDGIHLIAKAREKEVEEKAWDLYLAKYTMMDEESYVPFDEFYKPKQPIENKTAEEILNDVKETLNTFKGRWVA